jgi:subtilisin family serine protease
VTALGTLLFGSAVNSDVNLQLGGFFTLPNSLAGVSSISATGPNDLRTFYSNYGTNEIDVGAPGGGYETLEKTLCTEDGTVYGSCEEDEDGDSVDCEECDPPEFPFPTNLVLSTIPGDGYARFAGTSMAAPQVTGTAALVREQHPNANARQVENAIKQGADLVQGRNDPDLGAGRLNANGALDG